MDLLQTLFVKLSTFDQLEDWQPSVGFKLLLLLTDLSIYLFIFMLSGFCGVVENVLTTGWM